MYHSSRAARDRDRLREAVLRDLNWKLHRICELVSRPARRGTPPARRDRLGATDPSQT
ncbi:MAG: hypothetical protein ACLP0J_00180 [Solirubrobacteraceae bacterium]